MTPGRRVLTLGVAALVAAAAGDASDGDSFESLLTTYGVQVRASVQDKNNAGKPAAISWTHDNGGGDVVATDVGVSFGWSGANDQLKPYAEYHRNNQTTKKQDCLQTGIDYVHIWNEGERRPSHFLELKAAFRNDRINTGRGGTASLTYTPLDQDWLINDWGASGARNFMWVPMLSIQGAYADGLKPDESSGTVLRLKQEVDVSFLPFVSSTDGQVELLGSFQLWENQTRSGTFLKYHRFQRLYSISLNVYLDQKRRTAIGIDYSNGEDPEQGRQPQSLIAIALKIKI